MLFLNVMQRIYFRNRTLTICTEEELNTLPQDMMLLHPSEGYELSEIPFMMEKNLSIRNLVIVAEDTPEQELFNQIFAKVHQINAGGGLITNNLGESLMIYRNGVWDLPKGKQEPGEEIIVTAHREVLEEVGVDAEPLKFICTTHHTYRLEGEPFVKSTSWYLMKVAGRPQATPQTEEGIEKCEWVTPDDLDYRLANTYGSIIEVFTKK